MTSARLKKSTLIFFCKTLLIVLVVFESDKFISHIAGVDPVISAWLFAAFMSTCLILALCKSIISRNGFQLFFYAPSIVFLCVIVVSFMSAQFIFPKPMGHWLPSLYPFTLIFSFYFLYLLKASPKEAASALVATAIIVTLLLLLDLLIGFEYFDAYTRRSVFDAYQRRVVILKNEVVLGILIALAYLLTEKISRRKTVALSIAVFTMLLTQVAVMESRLALFSIMVGSAAILYLNRRIKKVYIFSLAGLIFTLTYTPFILDDIIELYGRATNYDANISIRFDTVKYLMGIYEQSHGWGVGMMSPTGGINNVLFSDQRYNFVDGGAFASIAQFGIAGLIIWLYFTIKSLKIFKSKLEHSPKEKYIPAGCFGFLIGFTINPLPLNFFLQPWTVFVGGIIIYYAWLYKHRKNKQLTPDGHSGS